MKREKMITSNNRPLSPHLSIYKLQISFGLSIMHRITGVVLFICILALSWFVIFALSSSIGVPLIEYNMILLLSSQWLKLSLMCILFCLYYHFLNGIRHLFWDMGVGFEKSTMHKTGWIVMLLTTISTVLTLYFIL
jgi:succinate dehydrogenase / fumarate reductase cytochrome b subunit